MRIKMDNIIPMKAQEVRAKAQSRAKQLMEKIKSDPTYIDIPQTSGTESPLEKLIAETLYEFEMIDPEKI